MSSISSILIAKALDGLNARQVATAQNIANGNTPSYRPLRVTFEDSLRAAASRGPEAIAGVRAATEQVAVAGDLELRLDLEIATASQTAARYSALISILDRQMQIARAAISGGR